MASILKALGFEGKPDYSETIPETLVNSDFAVHQVFHHGFPSQPTCIAYDPVQQILAIGTKTGHIVLLGKPGLEKHFFQPQPCIIQQLLFIINRGYLVSRCNTKVLCLWDLRPKVPSILHELQFDRESPTALCCPFASEWMYIGTDKGNIHMAHVENFQLSGYCVHWNDVAGSTQPGDVISIEEHPGDQKKVLFAYSGGLCALWNVQEKKCEKRYFFDPGDMQILTSVSWMGNGKSFGSSYSDGRIVMWSAKNDTKPEKIYKVHDNVKTSTPHKPIYKLQLVNGEGGQWVIFIGGYPEESKDAPLTLTINNGKRSSLLTTSTTIVDFLCLPSTPYAGEAQKPFLLVILTETELLARDLTTSGFPSFTLAYTLNLHLPPATCLQYCAGAPEEFVASLLSARSKVPPTRGTSKTWPLHGGRWGEENPDLPTDLVITGHADGTINLWQCNSVGFQRFFSIETAKYFTNSDPSPQANLLSSSAPSTPAQTPNKSLSTVLSRSMSTPQNSVQLPTSTSAPVFYVPLGPPQNPTTSPPQNPTTSPPQSATGSTPATPGPAQVEASNGEEAVPGEIPRVPSEDDIDGHRSKKHTHHRHKIGDNTKTNKKKVKPIAEEQVADRENGDLTLNLQSTEPEEVESQPIENSDSRFSVSEVQTCLFGWWLCVANVGGDVMAFNFSLAVPEEALKPHSLCINFDGNTLSNAIKTPKAEAETQAPSSSSTKKWHFKTSLDCPPLPGFYLTQHCQCTSSDGVVVNTMQYSTKLGLLAIGTKQGLAVVDVVSNQLLHVLNTLTSILYLADPPQYSKQIKKEAPKKLVSRVSTKMLDLPSPSSTSQNHLPLLSSGSLTDLISTTLNTVQELDTSVTVLRLVQMAVDKNGTTVAILWVGTNSGDVAAYVINVVLASQDGSSARKVELLPTGVSSCVHNYGGPIVNLLFLDKWGDLRLVPYSNGAQNRKKQEDQPSYVVVVTANKLKTYMFGLSGMSMIQKASTTAAVLKSDYFTCKDLPCLCSLMDDGKMLVHSLPGLKPLMESTFAPLHDPRVACTLQMSGDGLGVFMSSTSELERISIAAVDRMNLPQSLPDVFVEMEDPQPPAKGFMGYFTTPQEFDKDELFGEGAGRPLPSLAKRDGKTGYTVAYHKHQKITPVSQASDPVQGAAAQADTTGDQIQQNKRLLEERKEKLNQVQLQAERLQDNASDFAKLAEKLSKKYGAP